MSDCLQVREFVQVKFTLANWADFDWNFVFRQIDSINQSIDHSMPTSHGPFKKKCEESNVLTFQEFTFVVLMHLYISTYVNPGLFLLPFSLRPSQNLYQDTENMP